MQKELDEIKKEVTERIYQKFLKKYNGNKSQFAKDANVNESSIRNLFNGQGTTLNMLFKICFALEISPSELLEGLEIKKRNSNY